MFQKLTAISILTLAAGLVQVHAAPAAAATEELVIISSEVIGNDTITYWGEAPGTSSKASLEIASRALDK
jgi:ABC-type glycerol-3-phosphate transport system substrate-binding protein